jgi:hypothetical protein
MLKILASDYILLGEQMQLAREELDAIQGTTWDHRSDQTDIYSSVLRMKNICRQIGARSLRKVLEEKLEDNHEVQSCEELDTLITAFKHELDDRVFLHLPAADAEFYQTASCSMPKLRQRFHS